MESQKLRGKSNVCKDTSQGNCPGFIPGMSNSRAYVPKSFTMCLPLDRSHDLTLKGKRRNVKRVPFLKHLQILGVNSCLPNPSNKKA